MKVRLTLSGEVDVELTDESLMALFDPDQPEPASENDLIQLVNTLEQALLRLVAQRGVALACAIETWSAVCRFCGCTDDAACDGGCFWVKRDLCSACVDDHLDAYLAAHPRLTAAGRREPTPTTQTSEQASSGGSQEVTGP